jgi:hypothetical protein
MQCIAHDFCWNAFWPITFKEQLLINDYIRYLTYTTLVSTGAEDFSSTPCVQTGSGAHPASYPMGTGGHFPGGTAWPRRDIDHLPPSSAEVKYE